MAFILCMSAIMIKLLPLFFFKFYFREREHSLLFPSAPLQAFKTCLVNSLFKKSNVEVYSKGEKSRFMHLGNNSSFGIYIKT